MLEPLQQFYCDACGCIIKKPLDGEVIFSAIQRRKKVLYYDYKIVHRPRAKHVCTLNHNECNNSFEGFIELFLLEPDTIDMKGYLETMRRLTVPYYEEARTIIRKINPHVDYYKEINIECPNAGYFEQLIWMFDDL